MSVKIVINGFGRMGRLFFRAIQDVQGFKVVHVNDIAGNAASAAHLLQFDSVHGTWDKPVKADKESFSVENSVVTFSSEKEVENLLPVTQLTNPMGMVVVPQPAGLGLQDDESTIMDQGKRRVHQCRLSP